ncbi:Chaperone protein HtpG [Trichinella pseudospiralis]
MQWTPGLCSGAMLPIFDPSKERLIAALRSKPTTKAGHSRSWTLDDDGSYQLSPLDGIKEGPLMVTYLLDTVHHLLSDAFECSFSTILRHLSPKYSCTKAEPCSGRSLREFSNIETAILSIPVFAEHVEFIACPVTRMEVGSAAATYRINVFA